MEIKKSDLVVLITGPISSIPYGNVKEFESTTKEIRNLGVIAKNPHEFCSDIPRGSEWECYVKRSIKELMSCTDVVFMPGWEQSDGSVILEMLCGYLQIRAHFGVDKFKEFFNQL